MKFKETHYTLKNIADGHIFQDSGWSLTDPESAVPSLIRAEYEKKEFEPKPEYEGLYRYADWLPIKRMLKGSCAPVTYKSEKLAKYLGLNNLYITFSGYNPAIGARFETCSFKETEAYSICGRLPKKEKRILVVASAGNTARAFAKVCSENNIPLLLSIPSDNLKALWFKKPLKRCVKIIAATPGSDYFDAISLADLACRHPAFLAEGGAKNIARRDGMGTTLLSAVEKIGRIPDAYFQAIGSGTGAVAVYENNLRLINDGRFGTHMMRLYTSQNDPFTIMYDSWKAKRRDLVPLSPREARHQAAIIDAKVLSNRKPPYPIAGGVYDATLDSGGDMYKITNEELEAWQKKFEELEGYDIYSAAAVAVASLEKAVQDGSVRKDEVIMLNITGGGEKIAKADGKIFFPFPDVILDPSDPEDDNLGNILKLF